MMKNILVIVIGIMIVCCATSCKKFLDKKSNSSLAIPSTLEDLQALLDNEGYMNIKRTPSFGEASSDDYFLLETTFNNFAEENKHVYSWAPHIYNFDNDWSKSYLAIYNANYCLETLANITRIPGNQTKWDNVKGSALLFRSYYFLHLAWIYAKAYEEDNSQSDLGIVLRLTSDFNIPSVRATVAATYDRIILDATASIQFLPDHPLHTFRPSKAAAYGILSRTYLSMRQYDSAFKYADLCLQLKNNLMDYNSDGDINTITDAVPFKPFNKEIIFYTEMNTNIATHIPARAKIDTLLFESYDTNDLRKATLFRPDGLFQRFKGSYAAHTSNLFNGIAVDEIYLTRAECYARTGDVESAMNDLNTLLIKRWEVGTFIPFSANGVPEALNLILLERRKELIMRGLRWIDIKRLNMEGANITPVRKIGNNVYTLQPNANYYALPLPADVISQTGMLQN